MIKSNHDKSDFTNRSGPKHDKRQSKSNVLNSNNMHSDKIEVHDNIMGQVGWKESYSRVIA